MVVALAGRVHPVLQHDKRLEARPRSRAGRLARVVGLDPADRHERVGPKRERIRQEILKLACLVPATSQAGAIVPLDPDRRTAQIGAQSFQRLKRSRQVGQRKSLKPFELHMTALTNNWTLTMDLLYNAKHFDRYWFRR